jgi:membrane protease YdiL (CAAX protease family)
MDDQPHGNRPALPPFGWTATAALFGAAGLLLWGVTHAIIPALAERTGAEPVLLWFLLAGLGVFLPLVIAAHLLLAREPGLGGWSRERLRFRRLTGSDWRWTLGGLIAIGTLSALSVGALTVFWGDVRLHPSFMQMEPLTPGRYWILAVWLPFWVVNILGEELLWRGVVLPRQEVALGRCAWMANGIGWLLFHLPFGAAILFTLWPITLILPYVVQRTKNSWTGVLIHAALNGPAFIAVSFGLA